MQVNASSWYKLVWNKLRAAFYSVQENCRRKKLEQAQEITKTNVNKSDVQVDL